MPVGVLGTNVIGSPTYNGPIPDTQVPTVFGQINAIVQQAAGTALSVRNAIRTANGQAPLPTGTAPLSATGGYSATEIIAFVVLLGLIGLTIYLIAREV